MSSFSVLKITTPTGDATCHKSSKFTTEVKRASMELYCCTRHLVHKSSQGIPDANLCHRLSSLFNLIALSLRLASTTLSRRQTLVTVPAHSTHISHK